MNWLRRVLGYDDPPTRTAEPLLRPSPELEAARIRHRQLLNRADAAIKEAMDHADEMFGAPYHGPDRRAR